MKLDYKVYDALCSMEKFIINGNDAESDDFGEKYDRNPDEAEEYACANMRFTRIPSTDKVLRKYNISEKEYSEVCDILENELSFGNCGCCV